MIVSSDSIVEVKCSYSYRDKPVSIKTVPDLKHDENEIFFFIDDKHDYFYQIQGQMLWFGGKQCTLIIIYHAAINNIKYVSVFRDDAFILDMIEKLNNFYYVYMKPALLDKHFYRPFSN